jgi:hypothetical protein
MADLKTGAADAALREHLAAVARREQPWATAYHQTVDDLRRELAGESAKFHDRADSHRAAVFAAREENREAPAAERDAYIAGLMAGSYAYVLAAVLRVAGEQFGQKLAGRLACVADDILVNGDDHDRNADVMPAGAQKAST